MQILVNKKSFLDYIDIPHEYENTSKEVTIESYQDVLDLNKIRNVKTINIMGLEEQIKSIDFSNLSEVESIKIFYNFGLSKIEGLGSLSKLKSIYYPKNEMDDSYNLLVKNILEQVDLSNLLLKDCSTLVLSVFSIPIIEKRYPDFFEDFRIHSSKILFGDSTETFLQGEVYSTCTFDEAALANSIIDKWILENISSEMTNMEKFARIYEYVLGIDYDFIADKSKEVHKMSCSALKTLLRGKGICVGYAQLLKYMCLKCGLQCEYVKASLRENYDVIFNEDDTLDVLPLEKNILNLSDLVIPNHAIVRFSPDGINWLYSDPTNDSLFARIAKEKNKRLKRWPAFCLTQKEMELYNVPFIYDLNGERIVLNSELTIDLLTQRRNVDSVIFTQNKHL